MELLKERIEREVSERSGYIDLSGMHISVLEALKECVDKEICKWNNSSIESFITVCNHEGIVYRYFREEDFRQAYDYVIVLIEDQIYEGDMVDVLMKNIYMYEVDIPKHMLHNNSVEII